MTVTFTSVDPRTGRAGPEMTETSASELDALIGAARAAAGDPSLADGGRRAEMLTDAARRMRAAADPIVECAERESGLPSTRLRGELERTCVQLEMFADAVARGEHLEIIIDPVDADAKPAPRPDLRRILIPLGPVAVFGASNFPLAFSTAGGDTAAALAAGCPVVVKGHPAHPQTGCLVAEQLNAAVAFAGLPTGTFGHALSSRNALGEQLVDDDRIEAVAFTGSSRGGLALAARAAARKRPIPVFAEMGSLNPLIITKAALQTRGAAIAEGLVASVATFGGQLCTKPGIVLVPDGPAGTRFGREVATRLDERSAEVLVSAAIACALADGLAELEQVPGVERLTRPADPHTEHGFRTRPVAYHAHISVLEGHPVVGEEQFGPAVVILAYGDDAELRTALATLGGQLTMSLHSEPSEYADLGWLVNLCTEHCGRLVFDGYPTGVSVGWAMQHGGPYPATTDSRSTSVGMTATRRFLRPVTYQNAPLELLPQPLRNGNPLRVLARVDGDLTRDY